jgi:hypothetical protein
MRKHHWHAFHHKKLFEKQPLSHCQICLSNMFLIGPRSWAFPDLWLGPPGLGPDCLMPRGANLVKESSIFLKELATFRCRASDWERTMLRQRSRRTTKQRHLSSRAIFKWYIYIYKPKDSNVNNAWKLGVELYIENWK